MKRSDELLKLSLMCLAFSFIFLFSFGFVSSATGLFTNTTLNDSSKSGTHLIYVNVSECGANCFIGNVTFVLTWYNGSSTTLATVNNASGNQSVFSYSWDTTAFDDVNNASLNFSAYNYTGAYLVNATNLTSGIDIDNGNPTATVSSASISSVTQGYNINKGTAFTMGLDADNSIGFNSCLIYATDLQNSTVLSSTIDVSGNACSNTTLQAESFLVRGRAYNLLVQATDGNDDKTNSSTRRINYLQATAGSGGSGSSGLSAGTPQNMVGDAVSSTGGFFSSIGEGIKTLFNKLTFWTDKY